MDQQPPKPTRTRAPRPRRPRTTAAAAVEAAVEVTEAASAGADAAPIEAVDALPAADAAPTIDAAPAVAPGQAQARPELNGIEDDDDATEPGAPATRKAGKSDLRALGKALAEDAALRHAVFGADDPIEASDAWLRAARGVRLRKRQRAAMAKVWTRAGALFVTAASGELGHWLHHR